MGKLLTGFPPARDADVLVVVVVVVDIHAGRGEAPNNDKRTCADVHPLHQSQKQHLHLPPPLEFHLETRAFLSFSPDIGTKFCLDARYHDP